MSKRGKHLRKELRSFYHNEALSSAHDHGLSILQVLYRPHHHQGQKGKKGDP